MNGKLLAAALVALTTAGCVSPAPFSPHQAPNPTVVAIIEIGINPYHEVFRDPAFQLPSTIASASLTPVDLHFGPDWKAAFDADQGFWNGIELGTLYWFRGTRVLGIALSDPMLDEHLIDPNGHGTLVASSVLDGDAEAVIVLVGIGASRQDTPPFLDPTFIASGIAWASQQPWIDVVSISQGFPTGAPLEGLASVPNSTREAVRSGQVVIAGTGNDATPTMSNQIAGPPWVIKAGGAVAEQRGESPIASKAPDFVADFYVQGACHDSMTELCEDVGTSFAAPTVAGEVSRAIREARAQAGHLGGIRDGALVTTGDFRLDNHAFREAFNLSAVYWGPLDYAPGPPPLNPDPAVTAGQVGIPIGPTPWTQMGWGYVEPGLGSRVAAALLAGEPLPAKPPAAVAHMEAVDRARWAYWDR